MIPEMWAEGDKSCETIIPRSRQDNTVGGDIPLMESCGWTTTLPIFKTKHFSTETVNCQDSAQVLSESSAAWSLIMSLSSVTLKYNFASSANSFTFIPSF